MIAKYQIGFPTALTSALNVVNGASVFSRKSFLCMLLGYQMSSLFTATFCLFQKDEVRFNSSQCHRRVSLKGESFVITPISENISQISSSKL